MYVCLHVVSCMHIYKYLVGGELFDSGEDPEGRAEFARDAIVEEGKLAIWREEG